MATKPTQKPAPTKSSRTHDTETRQPAFPVTCIGTGFDRYGNPAPHADPVPKKL